MTAEGGRGQRERHEPLSVSHHDILTSGWIVIVILLLPSAGQQVSLQVIMRARLIIMASCTMIMLLFLDCSG